MKKLVALILLPMLLTACGPIIGQLMRMSEGVEVKNVSGSLPRMKEGATVLVYGPFAKTQEAYFVARGEETDRFAEELVRHGLRSEGYVAPHNEKTLSLDVLRTMTPEGLRDTLKLAVAPDYLLTGTLLRRSSTVAPTRGIVMDEAYALDLLDLRSGGTSRLEIAVRGLAQDNISDITTELVRKVGLK